MQVQNLPTFTHEDKEGTKVEYSRTFVDTGSRNDVGHNLTELCAAATAYNHSPDEHGAPGDAIGFTRHPDWIGHLNRFFYAGRQLDKTRAVKVLDVGCGQLQLPWFLNKNRFSPAPGAHYFGLDLRATENWLTATHNDGPRHRYKGHMTLVKCDLVRDDLSAVPAWPAAGFDLVVCFETFEHVPRRFAVEFMARLFKWTRPGGVCLFSTPNAGVSRTIADNHVGEDGEEREWAYEDKLELAAEAGFVVEKTYGVFTGITYLPAEVQEKLKADPMWVALKEFYDVAYFNCAVAAAHPKHSNNSLFLMRRPAA